MREIEKSEWANQTTIIVSSDHSWRISIWSSEPDWTPEEERISKGQFEPRPVFLVHFPGQINGYQVTQPTSELLEHDILAAMLRGEVSNPQQLLDTFHLPQAQDTNAASLTHSKLH